MASNIGKFRDRSPYICPAGKTFGVPGQSVKNTLQEFPVNDQIDALKHDAKLWQREDFVPPKKTPNYLNHEFLGLKTEVQPILKPGVKSRFQTFLHDMKETVYSSYWNKEVGKPRDPVPGLPKGMNIYLTTYGTPYKREFNVKDLINPPKTVYEVQYDSQVAHDWYRKSHNDYNPSEQINRNYIRPQFDPNRRYGRPTHYDPRGLGMQALSHWYIDEPLTYCSKDRANYIKRWRPEVGKCLTPNENIKCVPEGHTFGTPIKMDKYTVQDLLKDPGVDICDFKREYLECFQSTIQARSGVKHLKALGMLDMDTFLQNMTFEDKEETGFLPLHFVIGRCFASKIKFNVEHIVKLCRFYNFINGELVDYKQFLSLIDPNSPLMDVPKFNDIPDNHNYYGTSAQAAACDHIFIDNSKKPVAGVPLIRYDMGVPTKPDGLCNADIDHLGNDTNAKAVISPNIYTNYGLTYRDFFKPRSPEVIKTLFTKVGYTFPDDTFEKLWKMGWEQDNTGMVCVDTFKTLLDKHYPTPSLVIPENQCFKLH